MSGAAGVEGVSGQDEVVVLPRDRHEAQVQCGGRGADAQPGVDDPGRDGQRDLQVGAELGPAEGVGVESGVEEQAVEKDTGSGARGPPRHPPPGQVADRASARCGRVGSAAPARAATGAPDAGGGHAAGRGRRVRCTGRCGAAGGSAAASARPCATARRPAALPSAATGTTVRPSPRTTRSRAGSSLPASRRTTWPCRKRRAANGASAATRARRRSASSISPASASARCARLAVDAVVDHCLPSSRTPGSSSPGTRSPARTRRASSSPISRYRVMPRHSRVVALNCTVAEGDS